MKLSAEIISFAAGIMEQAFSALLYMVFPDKCYCPAGSAERISRYESGAKLLTYGSGAGLIIWLAYVAIQAATSAAVAVVRFPFWSQIGLVALGVLSGLAVMAVAFLWLFSHRTTLADLGVYEALKVDKTCPLKSDRDLRRKMLERDISRSLQRFPELSEMTWEDVMRQMYSEDHAPVTDEDLLADYREVLENLQTNTDDKIYRGEGV